jgi:small conductance mechanosensitive channel
MTIRPRISVVLAAAALLVLLLSPGLFAQGTKGVPAEILHVRRLDDGRWIGWTEHRTQRTRISIPQGREAIVEYARKYGVEIEWHGDLSKTEGTSLRESASAATSASATPRPFASEPATEMSRPGSSIPASSANAASVPNGRENPPTAVSEAEQVTRLETTIKTSEQRLSELKAVMANPDGEYQTSQAEFKEITARLEMHKAEVARLREAGKRDDLSAAESDLAVIEKKWSLARERFNLAIATLKAQQEQVAALQNKIRHDQQALNKLTGQRQPQEASAAAVSEGGDSTAPAVVASQNPATPDTPPAGPKSRGVAPPVVAVAPGALPASAAPTHTPAPSGEAAPDAAPPSEKSDVESSADANEDAKDATLIQAEHQADVKKEEAREAEREARSVSERLALIDKNIAIEQKLFEVARKKSDIAFQQRKTLQDEYQAKSVDGTSRVELKELARKLDQAEKLFREARAEVSGHTDRLKELQDERTGLQADEIAALTEAKEKASEAESAADKLSELKNPFSLQNVMQWLLDHGLKMGLIVAVMYALRWLVQLGNRRIVALMLHGGHGTTDEREARASTLMGVFHNAASVAITIGGGLMICEEAGVPVGTLMGSAAILGLAVAFGAQNLIRDYFYGFVILLENQYKINDVLKIGDVSGQVERITLRMTVLRDLEGRVHFIPNGKIDSVTNMTHGWSRAVFEIGVGYREDVDRVMGVLMELARGLKRDPQYATLIIDDPEMLGVDAFGTAAVMIKFVIKTRPLRQWQVKRELLRRIKRQFDELGIEIPNPNRTAPPQTEPGPAALPESASQEPPRLKAA